MRLEVGGAALRQVQALRLEAEDYGSRIDELWLRDNPTTELQTV